MRELKVGCGKPTGNMIDDPEKKETQSQTLGARKEAAMAAVRVGAKAPDFEAPAYQNRNFGEVRLSDYLGKWVVLCFYPGDFTFV